MTKENKIWDYLVSVIILTWNSEEYINNCIRSVFKDAASSNIKTEVIVIDNGSFDRTYEMLENLKREYPNIEIIKLDKNYGTTVSRNMGIIKSKGKYIFVLDSDTILLPGVLSELIKTIEDGEKIGIAAPRLIFPDETIQKSCKRFPTAKIKIYKFLPIEKLRNIAEKEEIYDREVYQQDFTKVIEVDVCCSAAWMINREAIDEVGLLDEKIFYSPEDVDYCVRIWLSNWKVIYNPKVKVVHYSQRLSYKKISIALLHIKGLLYFFRKYQYFFDRNKLYRRINSGSNKKKCR